MAPENENQPQRSDGGGGGGQRSSGGSGGGGGGGQGQQRGGGGGQQQRRGRKDFFDTTNIIGAVIWLISALLTAFALSYLASGGSLIVNTPAATPAPVAGATPAPVAGATPVPDVIIDAQGNVIPSAGAVVATAAAFNPIVFLVALLVQIPVTVGQRRLGSPWGTYMKHTDWVLNAIGFYWFACIQFNILPAVRDLVSVILSRMTFNSVAQIAIMIVVTIALEAASRAFFDAKGK